MQNFIAFENMKEEIEYARNLNQLTETQIYKFLGIEKSDLSENGVISAEKSSQYERRLSCLLNHNQFDNPDNYMHEYINDILINIFDWSYENISHYCGVTIEEFTKYMNQQQLPCDIEKTIIIRVLSLGRGFL